jgi:Rrf2 family nitric oxide-sensitive transcriptional repressor
MRLTKTTGHAIRILIDCADADGERVKVAGIAQRLQITQLNAFKIVHILSKADFLHAMRGRNGGVKLARSAGDIRIGDIVREIEATEVAVVGAETRGRAKAKGKASVNAVFDEALEAFTDVLNRYTLADLSTPRPASARPRIAPPAPPPAKSAIRAPRGAGRQATGNGSAKGKQQPAYANGGAKAKLGTGRTKQGTSVGGGRSAARAPTSRR